ncbi:PDR/VanB family oxidoreductase [Streptomyces bambusae]|uniref:PDR/VanB family oxidoreductase n=1 Tax=Streptomyces bambusae TaxID=1550616 RepID=UPI001CFFFB94|nr:PDR/VanB family oxidoreductase [Streptomyces bambusae]MCB5169302.1 PDR/VanB family oxidoreductase [Streptomyces bambusae]
MAAGSRAAGFAAAAGAAWLAKRALRTRIRRSPLWPLPALETPVSGHSPRRTLRATVVARTEAADGVVHLRLASPELPAWTPGAHVDLLLPSGLVRQYSLCGDPAETGTYEIAVRRAEDGRGGSREVHDRLAEGAEVQLRPPRNRFPLEPATRHVFVVGGIGITPVLPMLRALGPEADWTLLYGGRSRASMPFLPELARHGDRVTVVPEDEAGRPDLSFLSSAGPGTAVYCCGPEPLMAAVEEAAPAGVPVHLERFTAAAPAAGRPFTLELRRSGTTVTVAAGESALTAVRRALPDTPYSCTQGFCGTCQHRVLTGPVDHRDTLLTDEERTTTMLLCVSRAEGDHLVLDV